MTKAHARYNTFVSLETVNKITGLYIPNANISRTTTNDHLCFVFTYIKTAYFHVGKNTFAALSGFDIPHFDKLIFGTGHRLILFAQYTQTPNLLLVTFYRQLRIILCGVAAYVP